MNKEDIIIGEVYYCKAFQQEYIFKLRDLKHHIDYVIYTSMKNSYSGIYDRYHCDGSFGSEEMTDLRPATYEERLWLEQSHENGDIIKYEDIKFPVKTNDTIQLLEMIEESSKYYK